LTGCRGKKQPCPFSHLRLYRPHPPSVRLSEVNPFAPRDGEAETGRSVIFPEYPSPGLNRRNRRTGSGRISGDDPLSGREKRVLPGWNQKRKEWALFPYNAGVLTPDVGFDSAKGRHQGSERRCQASVVFFESCSLFRMRAAWRMVVVIPFPAPAAFPPDPPYSAMHFPLIPRLHSACIWCSGDNSPGYALRRSL
jgi:hypothetical protein